MRQSKSVIKKPINFVIVGISFKSLTRSEITVIYDWIAEGFKTSTVVTPLPPTGKIPLEAKYASIFKNIL